VRDDIEARAAELAPVVAERLAQVRGRIEAAGGDPERVRVVAVTKTFGPEAVLAAVRSGLVDIGENYADELVSKAEAVRDEAISWHFIGAIQRRKIPRLAAHVSWWETVARVVEAEAILVRARQRPAKALVEVNISGDPGRPGCDPGVLDVLVRDIRELGLDLRGLMAVAPLGADRPEVERAFRELGARGRDLGLPELSLGMSSDLEQAVLAGTTMVRLGTALFGPRHPRAPR
jgi:pyridoxal phosphate enzyme (YggS family)